MYTNEVKPEQLLPQKLINILFHMLQISWSSQRYDLSAFQSSDSNGQIDNNAIFIRLPT